MLPLAGRLLVRGSSTSRVLPSTALYRPCQENRKGYGNVAACLGGPFFSSFLTRLTIAGTNVSASTSGPAVIHPVAETVLEVFKGDIRRRTNEAMPARACWNAPFRIIIHLRHFHSSSTDHSRRADNDSKRHSRPSPSPYRTYNAYSLPSPESDQSRSRYRNAYISSASTQPSIFSPLRSPSPHTLSGGIGSCACG